MFSLYIHENATDDFEALLKNEPQVARRIAILLEELNDNPDLLDRLTQHDYGAFRSADFNVSKWMEHWNKGRDLWRLKVWDLEDKGLRYRVVYAFIPQKQHYHVLAIAPRDFNYDPNHPISQRILRDYQDL